MPREVVAAHAIGVSDADRVILVSPDAKALRSKVAGFIGPYRLTVKLCQSHLPSYVTTAIVELLDALDHWERDEKACTR